MHKSGCRTVVEIERLPLSPALCASVGLATARDYALSGGDDYELALAIPRARLAAAQAAAQGLNLSLTVIGEVLAGSGVQCRDASGQDLTPAQRGYRHFV